MPDFWLIRALRGEKPALQLKSFMLAAGVGVVLLLPPLQQVEASPVTYSISVTATDGPLSGTTATGTFTYDTSSIVPGGYNLNAGLLTDLALTWNGIFYDETTANTGWLGFDATGNLIAEAIGTNCNAGSCSVTSDREQWYTVSASGSFFYAVPRNNGVWSGTVTLTAATVPEPATLALLALALALAGLGVARRRKLH